MRALLAGTLALLGVSEVAAAARAANDEKRLGKDDLEFARALSARGYPDLAGEILAAYQRTKGGSSEDALGAMVIQLELEEAQAYREPDVAQRAKRLAKLVEERESFVKDHSGTLAADDVLNGLPDLYRGVGELIAAAVQQENIDSTQKQELRAAGEAMFDRAVRAIKKQREELQQRRESLDSPEPDPDLERQYMIASYNLGRTHYFHGLLLGPESDVRGIILQQALDVFSEFAIDYGDQLLAYEGYIYDGLCHKELGEVEKAVESFDAAIALRDLDWERRPDGRIDMPPETADVVSSAVLQKMLLLSETGDQAGAAAVGQDFLDTTPDALEALKGLAVLAQQAEAYKSLGDDKALEATARLLVEADPRGPGGELGRELLRGGAKAALGAADTLKLAETAVARRELERGVALCQEVMISARGTSDEQNLGARAGLFLGVALVQMGRLHDAVVAWDGSSQRYGKGKDGPECLWRTVTGFLELQEQERRAYYKNLARERMDALVKRYPESPYASQAAIFEGKQLEAEQQYARAAEKYESVAPSSPTYEEALYRAGNAWFRVAQDALKKGSSAEAKQAVAKSEELLKRAGPALEAAAARTLDLSAQDRMRALSFGVRISLANLYLLSGVDRAADVGPLFDGVETQFPDDAAKISTARNLRLKALQSQGKVDDAIALLDRLVREDPDAAGVGSGAAALAQVLDTRAAALRAKDPRSAEAETMARKAASYYVLSVRGQLEGAEAIRVDELEQIANRLFALAMQFGRVPDDVASFVDSSSAVPSRDQLEQAARIYEAVLPLTPSYRTLISLARVLGFLGRWQEAAAHYSELFSQQRFADTATKTIDQTALRAKPELLSAYLEWGVCEREAAKQESDSERLARLNRSSAILETLANSTARDSKMWWQSKYYLIRTLIDLGNYKVADTALSSLERTTEDFDGGKYGLNEKFRALKQELSGKIFR